MYARTDLAMEEQELWRRSAGEQTELSGVWARTSERRGIRTTVVKILDENGARQLRKPVGTYLTLELGALARRERSAFARSAYALAAELRMIHLQSGGAVFNLHVSALLSRTAFVATRAWLKNGKGAWEASSHAPGLPVFGNDPAA